jgi:hypothetical protein
LPNAKLIVFTRHGKMARNVSNMRPEHAPTSLQCVEASFGRQSRETVERTTLQEWAEFWNDWRKVPAAFSILHNLPLKLHSRVAAGFEIIARKA